jgi:hypothetical protein
VISKPAELRTGKLPVEDETLRLDLRSQLDQLHVGLDTKLLISLQEICIVKDDVFISAWPSQDWVIGNIRGGLI